MYPNRCSITLHLHIKPPTSQPPIIRQSTCLRRIVVVLLEYLFHVVELLFGLGDRVAELLESDLIVGLVARTGLVLFLTKVLNLLAGVFDFSKAERGG